MKAITLGNGMIIASLNGMNGQTPDLILGHDRYGIFPAGAQLPAGAEKVDVQAFFKNVRELGNEMKCQLAGMDSAINLLMVGLVSGNSVFYKSKPGSAKTTLFRMLEQAFGDQASVQADVKEMFGDIPYIENVKPGFRKNLTPDMSPSDLFGAPDIKALQEGRQTRVLAGVARSVIVMLDEFFKSGQAQQANLLDVMEEKTYTTPEGTEPIPMLFFMAGSNEVPGIGPFHAAWDRFGLRMEIRYPKGEKEDALMMTADAGRKPIKTRIDIQDLALIQCLIEYVALKGLPADLVNKMIEIKGKLDAAELQASPRRYNVWKQAVVAKSLLDGHTSPTNTDLMVGENILFIDFGEQPVVTQIIGGLADPDMAFLIGVEADIERIFLEVDKLADNKTATIRMGDVKKLRKALASQLTNPDLFEKRDELDAQLGKLLVALEDKNIELAKS
jgi:MoxR-like ATPases